MNIEDFISTQHDLSNSSKKTYRDAIRQYNSIASLPFEKSCLDKTEVHKVLAAMESKIAPSTWNLYLILLKRYARWLSDPEDEETPKFWRQINRKRIDWEKKLKDKWLSEKEFTKLLDAVDNPRERAMYGVAVEGALRAGELLSLKIRDCVKASYGFDVSVSGKTGSSSFPVVLFAPLLSQWLNLHPFKNDKNAPLWVRKIGGAVRTKYAGIKLNTAYAMLNRYAKDAGLNRKVSLHWLRHTRITWVAKNNKVRVSDEMARKMFRWSKESQMFSRYTHLHGVDSKNTFLQLAGVQEAQEQTEQTNSLERRKCLRCGEMNSPDMLYCGKCGLVLSQVEAERLIEKQRILDWIVEKWKAMGASLSP